MKVLLFDSNSLFHNYLPNTTVVGDYINTMKTTSDLNFDLNLNSFSLITCKLVIRKKLVNNKKIE